MAWAVKVTHVHHQLNIQYYVTQTYVQLSEAGLLRIILLA